MTIIATISNFVHFIVVLLIFIFVLILTFVVTKWLAKFQQGSTTNKNIKVIETFRIADNKFVQILQIGRKYVAISICKDSVTFLTELTEDDILEFPQTGEHSFNSGNIRFEEVFTKVKNQIKNKTGGNKDE